MTIYFFHNFEPVSFSMSNSKCSFLTCIHVSQETGKVVWYSHLFKYFPQLFMIHTVKSFSIVNEAEVDFFLAFPWFLQDLTNISCVISDFSASLKPSLYIWKFSVYVLLKPSLKDFEYKFGSKWNEHNCTVVWIFFGTALLWDWNRK